MAVSTEKKWIVELERDIKEIKDLEPIDRLGSTASIMKCASSISRSVNGWLNWAKDPRIMKIFTEDQLNDMVNFFKEFSIQMLNFDIEWTRKADKQYKSKVAKNDDKSKIYI